MTLSPPVSQPLDLTPIADAVRRVSRRDVFALLEFEPNPGRQQDFLDADEFDVGYGGAAGGGKTRALLMLGIRDCDRHPGLQAWCFRRSYPELQDSLIKELALIGYCRALGCEWSESKRNLTFPNGSVMRFRYCESMVDATRYQGAEIQELIIDERTQMLPDVVDYLYTRVRSGDDRIPVIGVRSGTNPGNVGHGAFKARYVTPTGHGERTYCDKRGRTVRFIPARISDNPKLNPEYERDLDGIADEHLRRALKDGDWDTFAGQFFAEWRHDRHVVKPFELETQWPRLEGIDWGYSAPWAVLWGARDLVGRVWVYRELYSAGVGERDQARRVLAMEAGDPRPRGRYADPSMWAKKGDAHPIATVYAVEGAPLIPAENNRQSGWQRVHSYLDDGPACPQHAALGWAECPMLHVFDTCPNLVRTLPEQVHDVLHPEDLDTKGEDHACLVAGTLVTTEHGLMPIEQVRAGARVWTRSGLRTVTAAGMTARQARVMTVSLSDGSMITGTGSHPVWVQEKGWVRLDALRYADTLVTCPKPSRLWCSTASSSADLARRGASFRAVGIASGASGTFTRKFGRRRTGPFRRARRSTTGTTTLSTTASTTSTACRAANTRPITRHTRTSRLLRKWRRLVGLRRPQPNGMARQQVWSGIASTAGSHGQLVSPFSGCVNNAVTSTTHSRFTATSGFARTTARASGGDVVVSTTSSAPVRGVVAASLSTSTPSRAGVALVSVRGWSDAGTADVYNLTVEGDPEFFANGVLVHNCDALRYLLMAVGLRPPKQPARALDMSPEARMQRHIEKRIKSRKRRRVRAVGA